MADRIAELYQIASKKGVLAEGLTEDMFREQTKTDEGLRSFYDYAKDNGMKLTPWDTFRGKARGEIMDDLPQQPQQPAQPANPRVKDNPAPTTEEEYQESRRIQNEASGATNDPNQPFVAQQDDNQAYQEQMLRTSEAMRRNAERMAQRTQQAATSLPQPSLSLDPQDGSMGAALERMQRQRLPEIRKHTIANNMLNETAQSLGELQRADREKWMAQGEGMTPTQRSYLAQAYTEDPYLAAANSVLFNAEVRMQDAKRQNGISWKNIGEGLASFGKDTGRHLLTKLEGMASFGMSDLRNAKYQRDVLKKVADANAFDNPDAVLTPQEKALYDATVTNIAVEIARQNDTSRWSKAGQITADMIPFIEDIMLGNALFKGFGDAGRKAITKGVEKHVKNKLAKWFLTNVGDVAMSASESAATAAILPHTYANMYGNMTQADMDKVGMDGYRMTLGGVKEQGAAQAWGNAYRDQVKELFTETGGNFRLIGRALIDNPLGKKILKTPFGMVLKRFEGAQGGAGSRFASMTMYHGVLGEWLEELEAAIYDGNLKEFFTADTQLPMLLSFSVPAAFTGGLNAGQHAYLDAKYKSAGKTIDKLIDASEYVGPDKNTLKGQIMATLYQTPTENLPQAIGMCVEQVYPQEYKALMEGAQEKGNKAAELAYALKEYLASGTVLTAFDPDMLGGQIADVQAHREQMRQQATEAAQASVQNISHEDGNIYRVGIKGKDDVAGYAFRGDLDVVPDKDGTPTTRGRDLITIKMDDGTTPQVPADELVILDAPQSAQERIDQMTEHYFAQYANEDLFHVGDKVYLKQNGQQSEESSTIVNITDEGVEVEIIDPNGQPNTTVIPHEQAAEALAVAEGETEDNIVTYTFPEGLPNAGEVRLRQVSDGVYETIAPDQFGNLYTFTEDDLAEIGAKPLVQEKAPANTNEQGMQTQVVAQPAYPTDETGNPAWGQMEVPQSAQVLFDLYKGNRESAKAYADDQLKEAQKVQKAAAKQASHNLNLAQRLAEEEQNAQFKAQADAAVKYWEDVKLAIGQIKTAEELAAEQAQRDKLMAAREQNRKTEEGITANVTMAERYNAAAKIIGNAGTTTLPDGRELAGHYVLIAPEGVTASHNAADNFRRSEGYPVTADGQSINDRDYTADKEEQLKVISIAQNFNGNALKNMPVISDEGLVYNGNGRMMAGQLAAINGTDAAYMESLTKNAAMYGFTPEQVASIPHARVAFQLDERLPYSTQSLAIFNEQETQTQSNTGKAAGYARKLTPQAINEVLAAVEGFNTIDAFFNDRKAPLELINRLITEGIIAQRERAEMVNNDKLSDTGRERLSNILFGTAFSNETIRLMGDDAALKNSIMRALPQILDNKSLGEFSLESDINDAIRLLYEVRRAGVPFQSFVRQTVMSEDGEVHTAAENYSPYQLLLAEEMTDGGVDAFRDVLNLYNEQAKTIQGGQVDIFGNLPTPTELKNLILQRYGKEPTETERPSAGRQTDNAPASAPASNEPAAEVSEPAKIVPERPNSKQLQGMSYNVAEAEDMLGRMARNILDENGYEDVEIVGTKVIGSRVNGNAREDSDLDCLIEFKGNAREDSLFNLFEEQGIELDGVKVDINPITEGKSGTIEQFMRRSDEYLAEKAEKQALYDALAQAEAETDTNPTEAQKKAENYKQGHVTLWGLPITIENPKGSIRRGTDANGKQWEQVMHHTYGKIRRTEGVDGDHIDVFIGPNLTSDKVFVVDQRNVDTGEFDEHKCMLGFDSLEDAQNGYLSNYEEGWHGMGTVTEVTMDEFKKWIDSSHRKTKPFAEYKSVKTEGAAATAMEEPDAMREELAEELRKFDMGERSPMDENLVYDTDDMRNAVTDILKRYNSPRLQAAMDAITATLERQRAAGSEWLDAEDEKQALIDTVREVVGDKATSVEDRSLYEQAKANKAAAERGKPVSKMKKDEILAELERYADGNLFDMTPRMAKRILSLAKKYGKNLPEPIANMADNAALLTGENSIKDTKNAKNEQKSEKSSEKIWSSQENLVTSQPNEKVYASDGLSVVVNTKDYRTYLTSYAKEVFAKLGQQEKKPHKRPELSYIHYASYDGVIIPLEVLKSDPAIIEVQAKIDSITDSLELTQEQIESYARRLLDNAEGEIKQERKAFIIIGRPAGGKSSVFSNPLSKEHAARIIDSDDAKPMLDGYDNGDGAGYMQKASDAIMQAALWKASINGDNLVIPKIGGGSVIDEIALPLKELGYSVELYYNEVGPEVSFMRAMARFAITGRYLSLNYLASIGDKPTKTFNNYSTKNIGETINELSSQKIQNLRGRIESLHRMAEGTVAARLDEGGRGVRGTGLSTLLERGESGENPLVNAPLFDHYEWKSNEVSPGEEPKLIKKGDNKPTPPSGPAPTKPTRKQERTTDQLGTNNSEVVSKQPRNQQQTNFESNSVFTADAVAEARKRLAARRNRLNMGLNPEDAYDYTIIAGAYVEQGVRKFADFCKAMIQDLGDAVRPYLQSIYDSLRHDPQVKAQGWQKDFDSHDVVDNFDVDNFDYKERNMPEVRDYKDVNGQDIHIDDVSMSKSDGKLYYKLTVTEADGKHQRQTSVSVDTFNHELETKGIYPANEQPKEEKPMSPMMKQFRSIKEQYPDATLMFRVGDFYELYEEDAVEASKILGITLTKRKDGRAFAGFPFHALDTYLPKLVRAGKRVAICDQLEDPKKTTKTVKRGVSELVTPSTPYQETPKVENTEVAEPESVTDNQEPTIPEPNVVTDTVGEITESKHTKTGNPIWIVKPLERVGNDEFRALRKRAKENNGYYSTFVKGYVFNSVNDANRFNNISDVQTTTEQGRADSEAAISTAETAAAEAAAVGESAGEEIKQPAIEKIDAATEQIDDQVATLAGIETKVEEVPELPANATVADILDQAQKRSTRNKQVKKRKEELQQVLDLFADEPINENENGNTDQDTEGTSGAAEEEPAAVGSDGTQSDGRPQAGTAQEPSGARDAGVVADGDTGEIGGETQPTTGTGSQQPRSKRGSASGPFGRVSSGNVERKQSLKLSYRDEFGVEHILDANYYTLGDVYHINDRLNGDQYNVKASNVLKNIKSKVWTEIAVTNPNIEHGDTRTDDHSLRTPKEKDTPLNTRNYLYPEDAAEIDNMSALERMTANVEALETLRDLMAEGREATPEERAILGKLRGWGGVNVPDNYQAKYNRLTLTDVQKRLVDVVNQLDPNGERKLLDSLRTASLTSYYTPIPIARAMHAVAAAAGYNGNGNMLDPSMGNGVFEGSMPKGMQQSTNIRGVELDWLTGQIAQRLYPDARINITGFQDAHIPQDYYDYVISNIPFGSLQITDLDWKRNPSPIRKAAQGKIHNYFAVKMIESTRPGGLCVIMTSNAIMDTKGNQIIREYITDNCEVLGAVRLPNNTFKGAGTKVVTDVIYLRKFKNAEDHRQFMERADYWSDIATPFIYTDSKTLEDKNGNPHEVTYSKYYQEYPNNMMGRPFAGGQYSDDAFDLESSLSTDDLAKQIEEIGKRIMSERKDRFGAITVDTTIPKADIKEKLKEAYKGDGHYESSGNIVVQDGKIGKLEAVKEGNSKRFMFEEQKLGNASVAQVTDYINLRTLLKQLIQFQIENEAPHDIDGVRKQMQDAYTAYVKKYGKLQEKKNAFISEDIDGFQVRALEQWKDGKFVSMADIYTKNTIASESNIYDTRDPQEAVLNSLASFGHIYNDYLQAVLGDNFAEQCAGLIFEDPAHRGEYIARDVYLSGDVVTKLEYARQIAEEDKRFQPNVDALESVQPKRKEYGEFPCHMGARWIPVQIYNDFLNDIFGIQGSWKGQKTGIVYMEATNEYIFNFDSKEFGGKAANYATKRKSPQDIFQAALLDKDITVTYKDEDGKEHVDQEATDAARDKVAELRDAFEDWVPQNQERVQQLTDTYNSVFNRHVLPTYNGQHLKIVGLQGMTLRPHQKDAVWRIINQRGGIIDHIVGAGKSLVMQASIMEMRRMGIAKKPMILALKSTTQQIATEFHQAFPAARVLAPTEDDFSVKNRKRFLAQIAVNDYDCIILSHEQYSALDHTDHIKRSFIEDQISQLDNLLEYLYGQKEQTQLTKKQAKGLEKRKENLKEKLKNLDLIRTDEEFVFENLGVDYLFVDECQAFKNLMFQTSYRNIAGLGAPEGSERSTKLLYGVRALQEMHQGDMGTVFLSGTTITNSLSELYNIFNYLRPNEMARMGLNTFDAWASTFAVRSTEAEFGVTNELKEKSRFRKFEGLQELSRLYTEIADVRNDNNLELPKPKLHTVFVPIPISDTMKRINDAITTMVRENNGKFFGIDPVRKDKYPWSLSATNLAKQATLSPKLIDTKYDDENGKIFHVCENIAKIYKQFDAQKGVQLIFCDTGVPTPGKKYDAYTDIIKRLTRDYGIPRSEIVDIHEANSDEKRQELFRKVNDGKVRILIGGTKNMGTGVNVQKRVVAMHHLDIPWTPADVNQRNGRGSRQGNEIARDYNNNQVDAYYYAVERTLDTYRYQLQDVKGKMIDNFKMANVGLDEFDEGSDEMSPAEMVAVLSGNPVILDKAKQDKLVDKLKRAQRSSLTEYARRRAEYDAMLQSQSNMEGLIRRNQEDIETLKRNGFVQDAQGNWPPLKVTLTEYERTTSGTTYDKATDAGKAIHERIKKTGTAYLHAYGISARVVSKVDDSGQTTLSKELEAITYSGIKYSVALSDDDTAAGQAMQNLLKKIYSNGESYKRRLEEINHKLDGADPGEYSFPKQAELDAAVAKKREIDAEYNKLVVSDKKPKKTEEQEKQLLNLDYDAELTDEQQLATSALIEALNDNTDLDVFEATDEEAAEIMESYDNVERSFRPVGGNRGYVGYSKSVRAVEAEKKGKRSISNFDAEFVENVNNILSSVGAKAITLAETKRIAKETKPDEWHHTSMYGNKTDYYSPETIAYAAMTDEQQTAYDAAEEKKWEEERAKWKAQNEADTERRIAEQKKRTALIEAMRELAASREEFVPVEYGYWLNLDGVHIQLDSNFGDRARRYDAGIDKKAVKAAADKYLEDFRAKAASKIEAMLTPDGTLYGWAIGDRIYLTKDGLNPNTPIHEYTHLWAKAMRRNNREGWQSIVNIFKDTPMWEEVKNDPNYAGLTTDDAICSEVLARYSGTRGAARMEEAAAEMLDEAQQSGSVLGMAKARQLISRVRKALSDFWQWVGTNLFGIKHFESAEQVADRVLWDMLNGTELKPEDQTTTNNFKAWFGDWQNDPEHASKVVDKKGRPLVVYHGSPYTFTEFRAGRPIYAFNKRNLADQYRHRRGNLGVSMRPAPESSIVEGYMNLRNPFIFEVHGAHYRIAKQYVDYQLHGTPFSYGDKPEWISADDVVKMVQEDGRYDGVIFKDMYDNLFSTDKVRGDIYVAFSPNQIKSATNNNGDFSEENDNIEMMISGYTLEKQRIYNEWYAAHPRPQYQVGEKLEHYQARLEQWNKEYKQFNEQLKAGMPTLPSAEKADRPVDAGAPAFVPGVRPTPMANETPYEYALRLRQYYKLMRNKRLVAEYVAEINNQADAAAKVLKKNTIVRGLLDSAKPIENFQEWMKQRGATITDESNAYTDTFLATGRVTEANEQMQRDIIRPLAKQIAKIIAPDAKTGKSRLDGINIVWHNMDVAGTGSKLDGKALTPREIIGVYCQAKDCAEAAEKGLPDRGAKGFLNNLGMSHDDVIAAVESVIPRAELDELWRLINAATHFALNYDYESGRISEDTHTEFYQREFYVPQRGWRERDESGLITEYEPVGKRGNDPYNAALVKAHGRQSLASDPFAYIMSIDASSIVSSENNKIKQKFLQFCLDNENLGLKTGAFRVKKYWIMNVIDPETGKIKLDEEGNPMMEVSYVAPTAEDLSHDRTIKELIKKKRKEWAKVNQAYLERQSHGELGPQLEAAYKTKLSKIEQAIEDLEQQMHIAWNATNTNITQRTSDEKKQHEVRVLLDGQEYLIEVQDEKLANAINKKFKQHQEQLFNTSQKMRNATRFMSAVLTQYNPEFAASNFARDFQVALATLTAEHPELVGSFLKNFAACQPAVWQYAFNDKVRDRAVFRDSELGRYLHEYFKAGAATGFSYMQDLKSLRQDFDAMINESNLRRGIKGAVGTLSMLTQVSETAVRFAGYVAARQNDMGINEAAYLSKELTTNFDRAGEVADSGWMSWFSFFRATLNGNIKFLKALKKMPVAYSIIAAAYVAMGMLNQFLNPDDPEDEVWAGDYTRQSNFVIGKWRIPTAHFLRMFFAAGVNAAKWIQGEKSFGEATYNTANFASQELLPNYLNLLGNGTEWNSREGKVDFTWEGLLQGVMPSPISPIADVYFNRDFRGATINREPFAKSQEGTKDILLSKENTLPIYKFLTQAIYEGVGGNMNAKYQSDDPAWRSWLFDTSASSVEHVVEGYMPAGMDMFITLGEAIYDAATGTPTGPDKWPFVRKFYNAYTPERAYMQQYYLLNGRVKEFKRNMDDYRKNDRTKYNILTHSQEYRNYQEAERLVKKQKENPTTADVQALIEANKLWLK